MSRRKGSLEETLSYCIHKDNANFFSVSYRDKEKIKTESLLDFITKEDFADIPTTRIVRISRADSIVWEKGQKQVRVKQLV